MTRTASLVFGTLVVLTAASPGHAATPSSDQIWYERIEADCKLQAKRYYNAVHFKKRRMFVKHCIDRAYR